MEGLIGVFIGAFITYITFYINRKDKLKLAEQDRKDKFRLASIDKRLEAHQKAYAYCTKLLINMDSDDENEVRLLFNEGRDFLSNYALYLSSDTRNKFVDALGVVNAYWPRKSFLKDFNNDKRAEAFEIYKRETNKIFVLSETIQKDVSLEPINPEIFHK
jgi:hypothetical protein